MSDLNAIREWLKGDDTGTSSMSICHAATGLPDPLRHFGAPYDPSDFGRCLRFLERFPETRDKAFRRLSLIDAVWAVMIPRWDEMVSIFKRDEPTGMSRELYDLLHELRDRAEGTTHD